MKSPFSHTCAAGVSAQVYRKELSLTVQVEIIIWCIRGDVVMGDQSNVKLEASFFLVYYIKHLLQAQPVLSYTHTEKQGIKQNTNRQKTVTVWCNDLRGVRSHRHNQPRAVWSPSNRLSSAASPSIHLPCNPSHRTPAGHRVELVVYWVSHRLWVTEWIMHVYLEWRVSVLRLDDVNTTGDLGHDWYEIVLDVAAVSS